jgi:hypothetical protein
VKTLLWIWAWEAPPLKKNDGQACDRIDCVSGQQKWHPLSFTAIINIVTVLVKLINEKQTHLSH